MAWTDPQTLEGRELFDRNGASIGAVREVWTDRETGRPEWITIGAEWLGHDVVFVPLGAVTADGDRLRTELSERRVREAPSVNPTDGELSELDEERLYAYYVVERPAPIGDTRGPGGGTTGVSSSPPPDGGDGRGDPDRIVPTPPGPMEGAPALTGFQGVDEAIRRGRIRRWSAERP